MYFNPITHRYTDGEIDYRSVTKIVSSLKKPFEKELIAGKVAAKREVYPEDVLAEWDLNSNIATDYGNSVHKGIELYIKYGTVSKLPHIRKAVEQFNNMYDRTTLQSEQLTSNKELRVAGTIDIIQVLSPGVANLKDIKTSTELDKKDDWAFDFDYPVKGKLKGYALQLSIYKYLLELKGKKIKEISVLHWDGEELKEILLKPVDNKIIQEILK